MLAWDPRRAVWLSLFVLFVLAAILGTCALIIPKPNPSMSPVPSEVVSASPLPSG